MRACRDRDPELMFPTTKVGYLVAKAICRECPLIEQCLELALSFEGQRGVSGRHGVWGGLDERERTRLARRRAAKRLQAS